MENQKTKSRIDVLREIKAKTRFLSLEPLLEDLDELNFENIHWVIVSGAKARPMDPSWPVSIRINVMNKKFLSSSNSGEHGELMAFEEVKKQMAKFS